MEAELSLDPLDPTPQNLKGFTLTTKGDYQAALQVLEPLPETAFPHSRHKAWSMGTCLFNLRRKDEGAALLEQSLKTLP